jgi:orotate phosphoribosyltransferase
MKPWQKTFIDTALQAKALSFGSYVIKSGRHSPYFFNAGQFYDGASLSQMGTCYAAKIAEQQLQFDVLFGPAYKGIAIATSTAVALHTQHQRHIDVAFNRKEPKDHGEGGTLIGAPIKDRRVLLIDDVISAGTTVHECVPLFKQAGATLVGILIAMDRQERGKGHLSATQELSEMYQVPIFSIITLADLVHYAEALPEFASHLDSLRAYQKEYGPIKSS